MDNYTEIYGWLVAYGDFDEDETSIKYVVRTMDDELTAVRIDKQLLKQAAVWLPDPTDESHLHYVLCFGGFYIEEHKNRRLDVREIVLFRPVADVAA